MTTPEIERQLREIAQIAERDWKLTRLPLKHFCEATGWTMTAAKAAVAAHRGDVVGDWKALRSSL